MLAVALFSSMRGQRMKAEDARRISDIERLKIAFEDYYGDNNCYPPTTWFDAKDDCGGNQLSPYLAKMPCDPEGNPYKVTTDASGCSWYQIGTNLVEPTKTMTCRNSSNYCASSNNVTPEYIYSYNPGGSAAPSSTPASSFPPVVPGHLYFYCSGIGNCTSNPDPNVWYCSPYYFDDPNCGSSGCNVVGSCVHR